MVILGLTGSIGMGKSTTADMFEGLGVPVHDADAAVHAMMAGGGEAVAAVAEAFPGVVKNGAVERDSLGKKVFDDPAALKRLEAILHPLVRVREKRFLIEASRRGCPLAVLDIPLLFETGGTARCDAVAVVTAPAFVQRQRVTNRPGMTAARFESILKRQMPDAEKRRRADFIIPTGLGRAFTLRVVRDVVTVAKEIRPRHWPR
ncbi:MAG: dephospho-CoA kinase [Rhodospirillales bacterium]